MNNLPVNKIINTSIGVLLTIAYIGSLFMLPQALLLAAAAAGVILFLVRIARGDN